MLKKRKIIPAIILIIFIAVVFFISDKYSRPEILIKESVMFVAGNVDLIKNTKATAPIVYAESIMMVFLMIFVTAITEILVKIGARKQQCSCEVRKLITEIKNRSNDIPLHKIILYLLGIIIAEEIIFRWFILGILTKISFLSGTIAFYTLFMISNGIWALIHLTNYHKKDRQILRVLPQFVLGISFTIIFVKHGIAATIFTHLLFNLIRINEAICFNN